MVKVDYPYEYKEAEAGQFNNSNVKGFIEGYAYALVDIMAALSGDSPCGKSYDPMTVSGNVIYSYAFDLLDGGRHHPTSDYRDVGHLCSVMINEAVEWIKVDEES